MSSGVIADDIVRDETEEVSGYKAVETSEGADNQGAWDKSRDGPMEERVHRIVGDDRKSPWIATPSFVNAPKYLDT